MIADPHWYEKVRPTGNGPTRPSATRGSSPIPHGAGWHMLITARANHGPADDRGVIGHATSPDLRHWDLQPPLSEPGQGFGQLEVTQVEIIDGQPVLIFSCLDTEVSQRRRATGTTGGVWAASAESLLGPYDIERRGSADRPFPVQRTAHPGPRHRRMAVPGLPPRRRRRHLHRGNLRSAASTRGRPDHRADGCRRQPNR